jgi:uncharacterized membrane protein
MAQPQVEFVADTASPGVASRGYQQTAPKVTASVHYSETYQATFNTVPIPSPDAMERLAQLYPDAPRIIFEEMQAQASHRRELEKSVVTTKNALAVRGQVIGGMLGGIGIVGSLIVAALGNGLAGFGIAIGSLVSLVSIFVLGRSAQQKNLQEKSKTRDQIGASKPIEVIDESTKNGPKSQASRPRDRRKNQNKDPKKS